MVCHFPLSTVVFRQSLITNRYRFPSWLLPSWLIATPTNRCSPVATRYSLPFSPTKHPPPQKQPCDEGRSSKRRSQPNWQPFLFGGDAVKVDAQKAKEGDAFRIDGCYNMDS